MVRLKIKLRLGIYEVLSRKNKRCNEENKQQTEDVLRVAFIVLSLCLRFGN
ncbi:hypothetical protein GCWU000325_01999 [Alloprevotella tannerae ATCC 51259]|uniref:Uncharacterized protein n=1 Tax=Alloprevotella tannerae ATCC 51259 TaxID=626522 RepID=C9LIE0_9BACT|nr:hypothetical protein GCWU000325_01999 [Alloprevotella tannerae ATCC 51259]